jgi:hypothetical protein
MDIKNIHWLAGILEGEGSFQLERPAIALEMTDRDIVQRVANIFQVPVYELKRRPGSKQAYKAVLTGNLAIQWMMTLYSLLGVRRKARIREVLEKWRITVQTKKIILVKGVKYCTVHHVPLIGLNMGNAGRGHVCCALCKKAS